MTIRSIFIISDNNSFLSEFCSGVRLLADEITAVIFSDSDTANKYADCGADKILYCPLYSSEICEDYAEAIAEAIKAVPEALVIVNNSIRGKCLAGKISALLNTTVISSVTEILTEDNELAFRHIVYGGLAQRKADFMTAYGVITISSGIFEENTVIGQAQVSCIEGKISKSMDKVLTQEKKEGSVNLVSAKRIIDVGRGLAEEKDLELCRKLAKSLDAEIGCSRPVAENNKWLPKSSYIGITGVQVKPELIIALGVSGQVQHIGGINKSRIIVAINKDKAAPIFKNSDFGIVGDLYKVLPKLIDKFS